MLNRIKHEFIVNKINASGSVDRTCNTYDCIYRNSISILKIPKDILKIFAKKQLLFTSFCTPICSRHVENAPRTCLPRLHYAWSLFQWYKNIGAQCNERIRTTETWKKQYQYSNCIPKYYFTACPRTIGNIGTEILHPLSCQVSRRQVFQSPDCRTYLSSNNTRQHHRKVIQDSRYNDRNSQQDWPYHETQPKHS